VSIGGALAEARSEAGLSITEVSERTRIRAAIIRDIERDDYAACGGDFYARGHIRAIAKVVGTDPVPLIAEYDEARMPHDDLDGLAEGPVAASGALTAALDPVSAAGPVPKRGSDTEPIRPVTDPVQDDLFNPAAVRAGLAESGQAAGARISASARAGASLLAESAQATAGWLAARSDRSGRAARTGLDRLARGGDRRPWSRLTAALALALLAAIGLLIYLLMSGSSGNSSAARAHSRLHAARHHRAAPARHNRHPAAAGTAGTAAAPPPAVALTPAAIVAFGPGGTGQSDDPHSAALAIDSSSRTAWHTSWYTTPDFGRLQSGTGLLLDMGQPVAVSSATVLFGPEPGGAFQLRAGNLPELASLQPVAQAADSGRAVTVRVSRPVRARYLLAWITRLPPDRAGTYQAFIYDIAVRGAR
jgi:transcriptional regulator with XRE-family HTH domain